MVINSELGHCPRRVLILVPPPINCAALRNPFIPCVLVSLLVGDRCQYDLPYVIVVGTECINHVKYFKNIWHVQSVAFH